MLAYIYSNIHSTCHENTIMLNLSTIPGFNMDYSKVSPDPKNDEIVKDCRHVNQKCCSKDVFDFFRIIINQVLHNFSGIKEMYENIEELTKKMKILMLEMVNDFIYKIYLSKTERQSEFDSLMKNFFHWFHIELRLKLSDVKYNINFMSLILDYNTENIESFTNEFNEATERNILVLYRGATMLSSITKQIQNIPLSDDCINNFLSMSICGICSENLDWTFYQTSDKTNLNVKICPKYCHNVVIKCLTFYLALTKPLKSFQTAFNSFIKKHNFNMDDYSRLWINEDEKVLTIFKIISAGNDQMQKNTKITNDIYSKLENDEVLKDNQDLETETNFNKCFTSRNCDIINKTDFFTKMYNIKNNLSESLETLIKPELFIVQAKKCDHSNFSRCWNGFGIGQYHEKITEFPKRLESDRRNLKRKPSYQRNETESLRKFIKNSEKNLISFSSKVSTIKNNQIEGSGQSTDDDNENDETYDIKKNQDRNNNSITTSSKKLMTLPPPIIEGITYPKSSNDSNVLEVSFKNCSVGIRKSNIIVIIYLFCNLIDF